MKNIAATSAKSVKIALMRGAVFLLLWWALSEGGGGGWLALAVVVFATSASLVLSPAGTMHWRVKGLLGFVAFFLCESLRGGIDVARRALHPRLLLAPGLIEFRLRLPQGAAKTLMVSTVSLIPGTLSADLDGGLLLVHVLDRRLPIAEELETLESRIADFYGVKLEEL